MIKNILKIRDDKRGTALLVALLIMGVLISISVALSVLILRELRITREALDSGKAYYAAEAGVEEALYFLNTELPGWHEDRAEKELGTDARFAYTVKNTCNSYPCYAEEEYDLASLNGDPRQYYGILELNENITIPLFTVEDGGVKSVKDFTVEFFAGFDPGELNIPTGKVQGWDVLRWKVFGMSKINDGYVTESINDFTAISTARNNVTDQLYVTNARTPSWFGTVSCNDKNGRVTDEIGCGSYEVPAMASESGRVCLNTEARDYYMYDGLRKEVIAKSECYSIAQFMELHQPDEGGSTGLNYLSLTNMMNPNVLDIDNNEDKLRKSRVYFRVETYPDGEDKEELVREFADITVDGFSGSSKQSINVMMKKDSYLPVFNFSIYSTDEK